jgi:hypothetical protein
MADIYMPVVECGYVPFFADVLSIYSCISISKKFMRVGKWRIIHKGLTFPVHVTRIHLHLTAKHIIFMLAGQRISVKPQGLRCVFISVTEHTHC